MANHSRPDSVVEGLLHPQQADQFTSLCRATSADELAGLRLRVRIHLAEVDGAARTDDRVDIDMARRIATVLGQLLDEPDSWDPEQRALLRGAVEYFHLSEDLRSDLTDWFGFDDDARVTNAVTSAVGRADLTIELG
ncbi:MAG: hypothetical protein GY929_15265 [Actinomycetia bacterium]|nr:hypothetical protein [Actinomycetes bacterium]